MIERLCIEFLSNTGKLTAKDVNDLQDRVPRIVESVCLISGEQFVTAVTSGHINALQTDQINSAVISDLAKHPYRSPLVAHYPSLIYHVVRALTASETKEARAYFQNLSTSYTLLAFLNQTPDVQKATKRIFSHGQIWLDTSVILPLFAEQLAEDGQARTYQTIYEACKREGDELFMIRGVVNEISHHIQNCLSCISMADQWNGPVPFLLAQYLSTGKNITGFRNWIEIFRGAVDPQNDIEVFLKQEFNIKVSSLTDSARLVDKEVGLAVERLWSESHEKRRAESTNRMSSLILKNHDVEMYLGVMGQRLDSSLPELGNRSWLLTKDRSAWAISDQLRSQFEGVGMQSPLLSVSFLINAITFSPSRASLTQAIDTRLPSILDIEFEEADAVGLLQLARETRISNADLSERAIQRKVREKIFESRRRFWFDESGKSSDDS